MKISEKQSCVDLRSEVIASDCTSCSKIGGRILQVRGKCVMVDRDLAELYKVPTKVLNQAVKRNAERFPERFRFALTPLEKEEVVTNCDHLKALRFSHVPVYAFTEQGVAMLATVLKSDIAVKTSIDIMDAFVAMRSFLMSSVGVLQRLGAIELKQLETDKRIDTVFDALDRGNLLPSGILPAESEFDSTTSTTDFSLSTTSSCTALARPSTASAVASPPTPPATRRRSPSCRQWCHERCRRAMILLFSVC